MLGTRNNHAANANGLNKSFVNCGRKKAGLSEGFATIRESETHSSSISAGAYQGTAAEIAEAVNRDRNHYAWFTDSVREDRTCPISENDMRRILNGLRNFSSEKRIELKLLLPDALPSPTQWRNLIENEKNGVREENSVIYAADERIADELSRSDAAFIESLRDTLKSFLDKRRQLMSLERPWTEEVVRASIAGQSSSWRGILRTTQNTIRGIEEGVETADNTNINYPRNINLSMLHDVVNELLIYLRENGGRLRFLRILPRSVVEHRRLIKDVRVNGRRPSALEDFQDLELALRVRRECERAWELWAGYAENPQGSYLRQMRELKTLTDLLERCFVT